MKLNTKMFFLRSGQKIQKNSIKGKCFHILRAQNLGNLFCFSQGLFQRIFVLS